MTKMTGGQAVVECIRRQGVPYAFCVPGESFLAVLDAFYDSPDVEMIPVRHEEGAGFIACAYAQATGLPGVAMATRGPGLTHLSIALHAAMQDSTPLVAFIGQVPNEFRGREAFQEVDVPAFFRPLTKWQVEITDVARVPELVQRAFRTALSGRPGPVVVSLPEDMLTQEADMTFAELTPLPIPRPGPAEVARAAELLAGAKSVAIIAGLGVLRAKATDKLVALAEQIGAPVCTAWRRFDAFPNDHPLYIGGASFGMKKELMDPLRSVNVILAVGTRLSEITTQDYTIPSSAQKLIHIDISPDMLGTLFPPAVGMAADAGLALTDLSAALEGKVGPALLAERKRQAAIYRARYVELTTAKPVSTSPMDPEGILCELMKLPAQTAFVSDAGNFSAWLNRFFCFRQPGTYFGSTSGSMGYGAPAAIGVKLAQPDRPVICLAGDGGFAMTMSEVQTAVRLGLKGLVFLVFNNRMYGTIRVHQERHYPGRPVATDIGEMNFALIAQGLGAGGRRLTANEELPAALHEALQSGGPVVLELMTRPERLSAWAQ